MLHAGIGVLMGLNLFELLMMTMLLVYFPPGVIRDRLRGLPKLPRLGYGFDATSEQSAAAAARVAAFDIDGQVNFESGKKSEPPTAATLFSHLRLLNAFSFLLWIPGLGTMIGKRFAPGSAHTPK